MVQDKGANSSSLYGYQTAVFNGFAKVATKQSLQSLNRLAKRRRRRMLLGYRQ